MTTLVIVMLATAALLYTVYIWHLASKENDTW
jgi:hypothetical protein